MGFKGPVLARGQLCSTPARFLRTRLLLRSRCRHFQEQRMCQPWAELSPSSLRWHSSHGSPTPPARGSGALRGSAGTERGRARAGSALAAQDAPRGQRVLPTPGTCSFNPSSSCSAPGPGGLAQSPPRRGRWAGFGGAAPAVTPRLLPHTHVFSNFFMIS